jgi:hypothetical protein
MDTIRVNIAYRPLRICWAITQDDFDSFRAIVRTNNALWGGRFNPIVVVDRASEAKALVETFRADIIQPIGTQEEVKFFSQKFKHLKSPLSFDGVFPQRGKGAGVQLLDVQNAMLSFREKPEWKEIKAHEPRIYKWENTDPLADVFLMQLGAYPSQEVTDIDYENMFREAADAREISLLPDAALPIDILDNPSIAYLSRFRLDRHYSIQSTWDHHGFYLGDASNLDDLIAFWNLRAADLSLRFVDRTQAARYSQVMPVWKKQVAEMLAYQRGITNHTYAIWQHREYEDDTSQQEVFGNDPCVACRTDEYLWNGRNLQPPMMHFDEAVSLGVLVTESERPKISFGLNDRPYSTSFWFHAQHLVASIDFTGGLHGRDDFTLYLPYVPELNDFYMETMTYRYNRLRIEPDRIGLIVDARDSDCFLFALPTSLLFKKIFKLAGFDASVSSGGLIARQLIAQLGGLQGGRVFKVPGARRLLKTHGPLSSFSKKAALQLIGGKDIDSPDAKFEDHKDLYLEKRKPGTTLTAGHVFTYLVGKRLFRIGSNLNCPRCQLQSWISVDDLQQRVNCQMCGENFDTTSQLVGGEWAYRRSGVLGAERNAQGAVPVVLTLQQLDTNLRGVMQQRNSYSVSLDLMPTVGQLSGACEIDFVWLIPCHYPKRPIIIIGECKDRGMSRSQNGDGGTINENDVSNLRKIADSLPSERFEVYILLAKLCGFTPAEVELAKSLNDQNQPRVIMLTERELEPYHVYDRTKNFFKIEENASSPKDLAQATVAIFLDPEPVERADNVEMDDNS